MSKKNKEKNADEQINKSKQSEKEKFRIKMDLTTIDDDEEIEVTEEALTFHSNVRENIVSNRGKFFLSNKQIVDKWVIGTARKIFTSSVLDEEECG